MLELKKCNTYEAEQTTPLLWCDVLADRRFASTVWFDDFDGSTYEITTLCGGASLFKLFYQARFFSTYMRASLSY